MDTHVYPGPLSLDEYMRLEEASSERHEYLSGEAFAMVGASPRHNLIAGHIFAALRAAGSGRCRTFMTEVKLRTPGDRIYYPDVMTVCAPMDLRALVVTTPCLVVEVTSPSTVRVDRVEKLDAYRGIPSLQAYLVVEQRERRVDRHWRDADGVWRHDVVTEASGGTVSVPCPETTLTLDEIYEGIELGDEEG